MASPAKLKHIQPLAQTFQIPMEEMKSQQGVGNFRGGAFITSVELFFFGKDEELPVFVEMTILSVCAL